MSSFVRAIRAGRVLLMDGATGTQLQRAGLPEHACCELWDLTEPARVRAIHEAYVAAGAECLLTNTFQANPAALARHGLADRLEEIIRSAVALARAAAGPERYVVADLGPGAESFLETDGGRALHAFAGVDAVLFETYSHLPLPLIEACRRLSPSGELPVLVSLTFARRADGAVTAYGGGSPEELVRDAGRAGIAAVGVNCGRELGMEEITQVLHRYRQATDLPLFARPNAGTPTRIDGRWIHPRSPGEMAAGLPRLLEAGARLVGGCCGTTPEHIAAFRPIVAAWNGSVPVQERRS